VTDSAPDTSQQRAAVDPEARDSLVHRTRVDTLIWVVGGIVSTCGAGVLVTAIVLWSTVQTQTARLDALTSADLLQVQTFSTEVSDADLILLSAANALPRVAVGTGTVAFDWLAPRDFWPGYAESITGAGSQRWTLPVVGTLTRRRHS